MRILGGQLRGRPFERPKTSSVRPVSGLVLEALFNILGDVEGLSFVDAYAGSGAIGFEALSRGAARVEGVEMAAVPAAAIRRNLAKLGLAGRYHLNVTSVERWLSANTDQFDIIVAGPPFAALQPQVMEDLGQALVSGGTLVVWHSSRIAPPTLESMQLITSRSYGDSTLSFYKHRT